MVRYLSLLIALAMPGLVLAEVKETKVSFETADGVDLQGTFYAAKDGGGRPTVILLHSVGKDPNKGSWDNLARILASEGQGFNVLRFDFRGHGKSTELKDKDKFWAHPANQKAMPSLYQKKATKIEYASFITKTAYFPMLVNDIMAARMMLDTMNDTQKTNTSSVYLIGATDATTLGMLYIAAEWTRPKQMRPGSAAVMLPVGLNQRDSDGFKLWVDGSEEAGIDIAGCVWLSPVRHPSVSTTAMKNLVLNSPNLKMREKNPMLFVHGDGDTAASTTSKFFYNEVLVAKGSASSSMKFPALNFTYIKILPKTKNIGVDLLVPNPADKKEPEKKGPDKKEPEKKEPEKKEPEKKEPEKVDPEKKADPVISENMPTEKMILEYLQALEKDRKNLTPIQRNTPKKSPLINLSSFGIQG